MRPGPAAFVRLYCSGHQALTRSCGRPPLLLVGDVTADLVDGKRVLVSSFPAPPPRPIAAAGCAAPQGSNTGRHGLVSGHNRALE